MAIDVTRWQGATPPVAAMLRQQLQSEPHAFSFWRNGPGDTYATHAHHYGKLLVCLRGSITFLLPTANTSVELQAGDRLYLSAQTAHGAVVGAAGVECAEAHLPTP